MRKGFVFDAALCVNCKACSAACMIENGLQQGTRRLYSWNESALPLMGVISLSMACNHCQEPACAEGCPAKAYTIEDKGVVIHHADRCIGCRYCTWRCPYDAPQVNQARGYIEKCHFCADRATDGIEPACVTACPTGALKLTEKEHFDDNGVVWFPESGIGPSVILKGTDSYLKPVIEGDEQPEEDIDETPFIKKVTDRLVKEWSLLVFSLLVISATAILIVTALTEAAETGIMPFLLMAGALVTSVLHLGVPIKAWRSVINISSSPLSREIMMVLILAIITLLNWLMPGEIPAVLPALAGLLALVTIDMVFFAADRAVSLRLHTGQAFFSGVYAASWFIEPATLFIVFTMMAAVSVVIRHRAAEKEGMARYLYYFRAFTLPAVFVLTYPGTTVTDAAAMIMFIAGVVADRALFFYDFSPVKIKDTISEHFITTYEKERDKQRQGADIP
jgi:Fe-S-cluster-containing dehydrogenase component/DMSO reductase anchor subunit